MSGEVAVRFARNNQWEDAIGSAVMAVEQDVGKIRTANMVWWDLYRLALAKDLSQVATVLSYNPPDMLDCAPQRAALPATEGDYSAARTSVDELPVWQHRSGITQIATAAFTRGDIEIALDLLGELSTVPRGRPASEFMGKFAAHCYRAGDTQSFHRMMQDPFRTDTGAAYSHVAEDMLRAGDIQGVFTALKRMGKNNLMLENLTRVLRHTVYAIRNSELN